MEEERYQDVCSYIRARIEDGTLRLGDRLPTERTLAETLGVSRGTVRDGLRLLESMGVLESRQGSGNYLSNQMGRYLSQTLQFMLLLGQIDYTSINRMRRALELQSYRIAAQKCTRENLNTLRAILNEMERTRCAETDERFHAELIRISGDPLMQMVMDALSDVIGKLIAQFLSRVASDMLGQTLDSHRDMIACLEHGRITEGCAAIMHHYDIIDAEITRWQSERNTP